MSEPVRVNLPEVGEVTSLWTMHDTDGDVGVSVSTNRCGRDASSSITYRLTASSASLVRMDGDAMQSDTFDGTHVVLKLDPESRYGAGILYIGHRKITGKTYRFL
jgi:hypothetical protein